MMQAKLDQDTFSTLVIQNQETLFHTAKAILRSDEDAEDAVQEAICTAFERRESLRETDKFRPWLLRILVNKCYDTCRRRRPTVDLEDVAEYLPAKSQDQTERLTLWQAVMALSGDLRAAVTLFYYDGLSIREISGVLGISEAAVKTRLSRGRAKLRRLLEDE